MNPKNRNTLFMAFSIVFLMGALAYASVPLYRLFCQITGYGGTTQRAQSAPAVVTDRPITVRFNADTNINMPWHFRPDQVDLTLNIGETGLAFYTANNPTGRPIVGTATYNVTPFKAGQYFHKIQCFCFEEQLLRPGEGMHMPVQFYIDPAILQDPDMKDVQTITLSYTFFRAKSQELAEALKTGAHSLNSP